MPDTRVYLPEDYFRNGDLQQELLGKADAAQAAGDQDNCIYLIQQIFDTLDRQLGPPVHVIAAIVIGLSRLSWIGDWPLFY